MRILSNSNIICLGNGMSFVLHSRDAVIKKLWIPGSFFTETRQCFQVSKGVWAAATKKRHVGAVFSENVLSRVRRCRQMRQIQHPQHHLQVQHPHPRSLPSPLRHHPLL